MKGKYFFNDGRRNIEIQEFDYVYVRNSLLKVFEKNVARKYIFNVIVSRTYDSAGMPIFDVRPLDLNEIFYDSTRLRVLEMMLDDIYFGRISIKEVPVPSLQQEYQNYLDGRATPVVQNTAPDVPAPIVYERVDISEDDPRLPAIMELKNDQKNFFPVKVLDWIDNFEVCSQEITVSIQKSSEEQIRLVQILKTNSEYIHGVFNNLTSVLESMFPLKPSFTQRLFGYTKDVVVKQEDIGTILTKLRNAVAVDSNRFTGISEVFKQIQDNFAEIKESTEYGIKGCEYVIATEEDAYNFELRRERLMKIRATTDISEMSLMTINKKFLSDLNKLKEVQEVVVPLLIVKLQNQSSSKVDEETVNIIRNLAYRQEVLIKSESDEASNDDDTIQINDIKSTGTFSTGQK